MYALNSLSFVKQFSVLYNKQFYFFWTVTWLPHRKLLTIVAVHSFIMSTKRRGGGSKILANFLDVCGWFSGKGGGWMIFADIHIYIYQTNLFLFFLWYVKISYIICQFLTVALLPWDLINFISMTETHEVQLSFVKICSGNVCLLSCHLYLWDFRCLRREIFAGIYYCGHFFNTWI